jgi:dienelactone hydrolase
MVRNDELTIPADITVPVVNAVLGAFLSVPEPARGIVLFIHGSGSSRFSPRNQRVAEALNRHGLATLLLDLLTPEEQEKDERTGELRFDVELLGRRSVQCIDSIDERESLARLPLGLFGASTGAAAALIAAAERPERVAAVVSRGGRPDLAMPVLADVHAPTLFIVGALDQTVLELNQQAAAALGAPHHIEVVAGASHLFEEPGKLDVVADLAGRWFAKYLGGGR